jgi:STE24 endopeptidase
MLYLWMDLILELTIWGTYVPSHLWWISGEILGSKATDTKQALIYLIFVHFYRMANTAGWDLYFALDIKQRHGLNKLTPRTYIMDQIKLTFLWGILGAPAFCLFMWVIELGGKIFPVYLVLLSVGLMVLYSLLYLPFIAPLFNTFHLIENY